MRFRRHVPQRANWKRWLRQAVGRFPKVGQLPRFSRLRELGWVRRLPGGKGVWLWAGCGIGAFGVGYLIAALVLFPAPIFATAIAVPDLLGMTEEEAEQALSESRLALGDVRVENHPTVARGDVFWQDPPPGVGVPPGHTVDLTKSGGPQRIPVPDLTGYEVGIAEQLILAAGLVLGRRETTQAPAPRGVVINSRPPAGSMRLPGTEITLVVSVGAPTITVPDLQGLTRAEADSVLQGAGLTLGTAVRRRTREGIPGTVITQVPAPGTLSAPGTAVNITLARETNE